MQVVSAGSLTNRTQLLFLVGGHGIGKTTVGLLLGKRIGYDFCDIDERICDTTGGGATLHQDMWSEMKTHVFAIWLAEPVDVLIDRIRTDRIAGDQGTSLTGTDIFEAYRFVYKNR